MTAGISFPSTAAMSARRAPACTNLLFRFPVHAV